MIKLNNVYGVKCDTPKHLYILPMINSVPVIKLGFEENYYIANYYKHDIKTKVNDSTWIDLLEINEYEYYSFPTKQKKIR